MNIILPMSEFPKYPRVGLETRVRELEAELDSIKLALGSTAAFKAMHSVEIFTFSEGKKPMRQTEGAIGFDAYSRAVVDPTPKPTANHPLRDTLADFRRDNPVHESLQDWVVEDKNNPSKYAIALPPQERLMVGLGFATSMHYPMFYWVAPRSGYAAKGITVANSPGVVDPDYRGEAGALIENNSREDFVITHNMRIVQIIFNVASIPNLNSVDCHSELGDTTRGAGGFGSTGTHN